MEPTVVDTSVLLVLTQIQRLNLLAKRAPIWVSNAVYKEHRRNASPESQQYLDASIEEGLVEVRHPAVTIETDFIRRKYRALSLVDAEGVAWAIHEQAFLLCEDDAFIDAADAEGVDWVDLCDLLKACRDEGVVYGSELRSLVHAIELDANHGLSERCKSDLGI